MQIILPVRHAANPALIIIALFLTVFAPVSANETGWSPQAEIRYIDRSKGEVNRAYPVSQPPASSQFTQRQQSDGLLLWRIEHIDRNSSARSNYIFGTIHIDDARVMSLPDSILQRLLVADTLMLELELSPNGSVDVLRKMLFTDGRNLTQVIGESAFNEVNQALINTGNDIPDDILTFLKPWAAMLLLIKPENNTGTFLDKQLADMARNSGIKVQGLETVNEQLSVFDEIAIEDQISLLYSAMSTLTDKDISYRKLLDAYLSGDMEEIVSIANSQQPKDKRLASLLNDKLIISRNQKMFDRMQEQLQAGNTFIAVGALHLPGEQGLLNKLSQAGYRLIRIDRNE